MKRLEELKTIIDSMSHYELATLWGLGKSSNELLQGDAGEYFKDRLFNHFGGFNPSLNKSLGVVIMKLTDNVKIVFKNPDGDTKEITITVDALLDNTRDDIYDMLERTVPHSCSSSNTESQNFCDCGLNFEDYIIEEINIV